MESRRKPQTLNEIKIEEIRFRETLDRGERLLDELISSGQKMITGFKAFELYDTYGFPLELTEEIAQENNIGVDIKGFDKEMSAQKERAKAASQIIDLTFLWPWPWPWTTTMTTTTILDIPSPPSHRTQEKNTA